MSQSEAQAKEEQKKRITSSGTFSSPKAVANTAKLNEKVYWHHDLNFILQLKTMKVINLPDIIIFLVAVNWNATSI